MDIKRFQEKLSEICKLAAECDQKLTAVQLKDFLEELKPDKDQLIQILKYFRLQGITIEGLEVPGELAEEQENAGEAKIALTPDEKAYIKEYKEFLGRTFDAVRAGVIFRAMAAGDNICKKELSEMYLPVVADIAVEMYDREMQLADLIQEANVCLLTALEQQDPKFKDDIWLRKEIRKGIRQVLDENSEQKFGDDCLVEKVQKLESAVKDLSENDDGTEDKFTVGELAIILDMEIDEIRDILRLTGDDVSDGEEMPEDAQNMEEDSISGGFDEDVLRGRTDDGFDDGDMLSLEDL